MRPGGDRRGTVGDLFNVLAAHKNELVLPGRFAYAVDQCARADDSQRCCALSTALPKSSAPTDCQQCRRA